MANVIKHHDSVGCICFILNQYPQSRQEECLNKKRITGKHHDSMISDHMQPTWEHVWKQPLKPVPGTSELPLRHHVTPNGSLEAPTDLGAAKRPLRGLFSSAHGWAVNDQIRLQCVLFHQTQELTSCLACGSSGPEGDVEKQWKTSLKFQHVSTRIVVPYYLQPKWHIMLVHGRVWKWGIP